MNLLAYFIVEGGIGTLIDVLVLVVVVALVVWVVRKLMAS